MLEPVLTAAVLAAGEIPAAPVVGVMTFGLIMAIVGHISRNNALVGLGMPFNAFTQVFVLPVLVFAVIFAGSWVLYATVEKAAAAMGKLRAQAGADAAPPPP